MEEVKTANGPWSELVQEEVIVVFGFAYFVKENMKFIFLGKQVI